MPPNGITRAAFQKVTPFTSFTPSAEEHNAMIDAALANKQGQNGNKAGQFPFFGNATLINVKNSTGGVLSRFKPVLINDVVVPEATDADEFKARVWFDGGTPACGGDPTTQGLYGIAQEDIKSGDTGIVCCAGICIASVDIDLEKHKFCKAGSPDLDSAFYGGTRILYKPTGTGVKLCVVSLHSGPEFGETFAVKVHNDGGSAGVDKVSDCTFTYALAYLDDDATVSAEQCETGVALSCERHPKREYIAAPDNSIGEAVIDETCAVKLLRVCELTANCCDGGTQSS